MSSRNLKTSRSLMIHCYTWWWDPWHASLCMTLHLVPKCPGLEVSELITVYNTDNPLIYLHAGHSSAHSKLDCIDLTIKKRRSRMKSPHAQGVVHPQTIAAVWRSLVQSVCDRIAGSMSVENRANKGEDR